MQMPAEADHVSAQGGKAGHVRGHQDRCHRRRPKQQHADTLRDDYRQTGLLGRIIHGIGERHH